MNHLLSRIGQIIIIFSFAIGLNSFADQAGDKKATELVTKKEAVKEAINEVGKKGAAVTDKNKKGKEKVMIEMKTSKGTVKIALNKELAPLSTKNFLTYAEKKFYDGTVFHRVIKGFMIQGGGFELAKDELKKKDTGEPIKNEAKNGLKNERGTIAMARTQDPHSATSQFYINHKDNPNLDYPSFDGWGYTVFGKVIEGLDVIDEIAKVPTKEFAGYKDVPSEEVKIISVKVIK